MTQCISIQILKGVADFFEGNPTSWIQGQYARNKKGESVVPWSGRAEKWCVEGRIRKVAHDIIPNSNDADATATHAIGTLARFIPGGNKSAGVYGFNDAAGQTVEGVIALLRHAIKNPVSLSPAGESVPA